MNAFLLSLSFPRHSSHSTPPRHSKKRGLRSRADHGFTLIELLTVISIIAILMGLLFPAVATVKDNARKTQARNDVTAIVAAVKHYYTEYGKYPPMSTAATAPAGDVYVGETVAGPHQGPNSNLFYVLRAIDDATLPGAPSAPVNTGHIHNPRRIVFFEGKSVAKPSQPRGGFLDPVAGGGTGGSASVAMGSFFDPWGKQYCVMVDSNYDNICDLAGIYSSFATATSPRTGVLAWSLGKDLVIGSATPPGSTTGNRILLGSDDVVSWQ
jgi:prepilin-type N-terminal cleavage/methylation domain-containing protein